MDFTAIRVFLKVAELGGITRAAQALGVPKSYVSRKLTELEEALEVRLIERSSRAVALTEAGAYLVQSCAPIALELDEVEAALKQLSGSPRGILRISAPVEFGGLLARTMLPAFMRRYPQVQIELDLSNKKVDLVGEGYDLAIRFGETLDASMVCKQIGRSQLWLYASRAYLDKHGEPKQPEELAQHTCMGYRGQFEHEWTLYSGSEKRLIMVRSQMCSNNLRALKHMAEAGIGIVRLPSLAYGGDDLAGLVHILPAWYCNDVPVCVVYASRRFLPAKVRVFVDALTAYMSERG